MKKVISLILIFALLLMVLPTIALAESPGGTWTVDIGNLTSETQSGIFISGWGPIEPATSGGNYGGIGDCRVVWEPPTPEESLRCAVINFVFDDCANPTELSWSVLEGIGDDSYEAYIDDVLIYSYSDPDPTDSTEDWVGVSQDLTGFGLPNDVIHRVKFCATGSSWALFSTYGQVAFDWVGLTTEECGGNSNVEMNTIIIEPECICIDVSPSSLNFGSLYPGQEKTLSDALTVTNCGNVDVDVTTTTTSSFYQNNLWLEGSSWYLVADWQENITVGNDLTIDAKIEVPVSYSAGTETATVIFWAEEA